MQNEYGAEGAASQAPNWAFSPEDYRRRSRRLKRFEAICFGLSRIRGQMQPIDQKLARRVYEDLAYGRPVTAADAEAIEKAFDALVRLAMIAARTQTERTFALVIALEKGCEW